MLNEFFGSEPVNSDTFTEEFLKSFAKEIICHLHCDRGDITGANWEKIFANCIGAPWTAGNKFYDVADIRKGIAWSAKTVKDDGTDVVPLISGRNSPLHNFDRVVNPKKDDPKEIGKVILDIWNSRVAKLKSEFTSARTAVLLRAENLLSYRMFDFETECYDTDAYNWCWTDKNNLRAYGADNKVRFLWQPKGSQFTIYKDVPRTFKQVSVRNPPVIRTEDILGYLKFDASHYRIYHG